MTYLKFSSLLYNSLNSISNINPITRNVLYSSRVSHNHNKMHQNSIWSRSVNNVQYKNYLHKSTYEY